MVKRKYYVCSKCFWQCCSGEVIWGLLELESLPQRSITKPPCSECGRPFEPEIHEEQFICPKCGYLLKLTEFVDESEQAPEIMGAQYKKPVHSDSLGLMPSQVAEHRKKFPYIPIDGENRPVFTNKTDHEKYMKECGIVNNPSRNKPKRKYFTKTGDN